MTSTQQHAALQRQIWQIANDVRGSVDGWDFKQYVLGTLFYRFIIFLYFLVPLTHFVYKFLPYYFSQALSPSCSLFIIGLSVPH